MSQSVNRPNERRVLTDTFIAIAQAYAIPHATVQETFSRQDRASTILIYCHSLDLVTAIDECKCWKSDKDSYGIEITSGNVPKLSQ
jgi:hypothetical protein